MFGRQGVLDPHDQSDLSPLDLAFEVEDFVELRELRDRLQTEFHVDLAQLSMGMTQDFAIAVEEGATLVRVGTAIFGERSKRRKE